MRHILKPSVNIVVDVGGNVAD